MSSTARTHLTRRQLYEFTSFVLSSRYDFFIGNRTFYLLSTAREPTTQAWQMLYITGGAMEKIFGFKSCFGAYNWGVGVLPKLLEVHSPLPPPPLSRPGFPSVYPSYCCVLPKILKLSSNLFTTFHQYPGSSPAILVLSYQTCGEIPTGTLRASAV